MYDKPAMNTECIVIQEKLIFRERRRYAYSVVDCFAVEKSCWRLTLSACIGLDEEVGRYRSRTPLWYKSSYHALERKLDRASAKHVVKSISERSRLLVAARHNSSSWASPVRTRWRSDSDGPTVRLPRCREVRHRPHMSR